MNDGYRMTIVAGRAAKALFMVAIILTAAHIAVMFLWFADLLPFDEWWQIAILDLDEEESIGTWFSAIILFVAGLLLMLQAGSLRQDNKPWWKWWMFLGLGFIFLSVDEVAGFHEYLNTVISNTHWTTFGAAIFIVIGLAYIPFLAALNSRTRWLFVLSGFIYAGGAVVIERATEWYRENQQLYTLAYNLWTAVEEFMEMAAIILFIYALLQNIASDKKGFLVKLQIDA